jgi:hypothetical protein
MVNENRLPGRSLRFFRQFFYPEINNLALKGEVCCSPEVMHSGFNTFVTALKGGVLNPSARIKLPADRDDEYRIIE